MHELSIAMSILEAVEDEAAHHKYATIHAIHVRIGALSGIVPEALQSAYELAVENTRFAETRLAIETIPISVYCPTCREPRQLGSAYDLRCPDCETVTPEILAGRELDISRLEVST
jgi:hydrogenase nickel incorporation protein HypA/HybF